MYSSKKKTKSMGTILVSLSHQKKGKTYFNLNKIIKRFKMCERAEKKDATKSVKLIYEIAV